MNKGKIHAKSKRTWIQPGHESQGLETMRVGEGIVQRSSNSKGLCMEVSTVRVALSMTAVVSK
jgi:hypothetical protein